MPDMGKTASGAEKYTCGVERHIPHPSLVAVRREGESNALESVVRGDERSERFGVEVLGGLDSDGERRPFVKRYAEERTRRSDVDERRILAKILERGDSARCLLDFVEHDKRFSFADLHARVRFESEENAPDVIVAEKVGGERFLISNPCKILK